jgi:SAM-dependent methyltransferase
MDTMADVHGDVDEKRSLEVGLGESVRFGWETWVWDETVFHGTAPFYRQGRTPYAATLADTIADALHLDGSGRLLDVGCGPGTVTLRLAYLFEAVVGLDPDDGMLAEARLAADERDVMNATWVQLRAEELPAHLGSFRIITFAQSFHWMDRPKVASAVRSMIEPNGAVVQIDDRVHSLPTPSPAPDGVHPAPPEREIDELRRRYLGADRRAGRSFRNTSPSGENAIFQAAGFREEVCITVPDGRVIDRTIDDIVAWVFAASSTAPPLFGDRLRDFERDLRALLAERSPSGLFSVRLPDNELRIRRPTAAPA